VDLVVSPTTVVALNPQQGAALPALRTGEVVEAQVLQAVADAAQIAIGNTILEVQTQIALTPGTTVKLAVSNSPQGLRLALVGGTGAAGAPGTGNGAVAAAGSDGIATTLADGVEIPAVNTTPAAAPQDAPATVTASGSAPADPAVVTAAAGGTANSAAGTSANGTAATITADVQATSPQTPNPVIAATAALAAAVQSSAARQGGLGPLFADASVAATISAVPEPVRQAAERLLALPPILNDSISADDVKQALDRSGLFLEARLSAQVSARANGGTAAPASADDLKAALVVLRNAVKSWLASDLTITPDLKGALSATSALGRIAAQLVPDSGAPNGQAAQAAQSGARAQNVANPPPPPYRGAPTAGQPASTPSISADMAPRDIGKVLLNEADAALARQTLLQAASLPDHVAASLAANGPVVRNDPSGPRWLFEVPFATPQGPAVAQFEIARDGHNAPAAGTAVAWRARFSLDVEPIGPVHAQIALTGSRAAVTLWAERPETSAKLRDNAPELANALRAAELEPSDVLVRGGTPPRPREAAPSGRFLDRAS